MFRVFGIQVNLPRPNHKPRAVLNVPGTECGMLGKEA